MSDSEYLDAVRRGDMKAAQRMVDAAAKAAGYDIRKLYHGNESGPFKSINRPLFLSESKNEAKAYSEETDVESFVSRLLIPMSKSEVRFPSRMDVRKAWPVASDFIGGKFTPQMTGEGDLFYWGGTTNAYGDHHLIFISDRIADDSGDVVKGTPAEVASKAPQIKPFVGVYYVAGKLLPVRDSRFADEGHPSAVNVIATRLGGDGELTKKWAMLLKRNGYSGIDTFSDDGLERGLKVRNVVMFDPRKIKSADPVTYDDAGNVIPLSQRFNAASDDIRNPKRQIKRRLKKNPLTYSPDEVTESRRGSGDSDINAAKVLWDTPAFKKWFGDSKVRDVVRRPMVVYHGTCASGFTKFDPTKTQEMGFHFGTQAQAKDFLKGCGTYRGKKAGIYPVYLSIQNPLFTPDVYSDDPVYFIEWAERTNHIHQWFPDEDDSYYRSLNRLREQIAEAKADTTLEGMDRYNKLAPLRKKAWGLLRKVVMRKGYDGVRYKNENEGQTDSPSNIAWIAFSPAQVKSATENRGTFNRRDPDLRNPMKSNPKDRRSALTQIAGTVNTYRKAAKMLGGKVLDYGAGFGLGTDELRSSGLLTDSFEPFPEKWVGKRPPTYTDSVDIPNESYDSLVSFSVINVVDPDERKLLFKEVARILRPDGFALITGRDREDVEKSTTKIPHLEKGGYLVGKGKEQRYQKGFTQAELERYAKEVLGPGFTVETNKMLNGASIKITKGKTNPVTRSMIRNKLSRIIEPGDRILDYDRAQGEDLYRLWDMVHTDMPLNEEALTEIEGLLDDDGVLVIQSGEEPSGLRDHFRRATRYNGMLLVQGPMNPEEARINTEKLRRDLE